jgi:hypothetical protein
MSEVTYLYNDQEVKLTGREAVKKGRSKVVVRYEITPVILEDGSWTKWVQLSELFVIKQGESE